ncbi:hypothetical protein [Clostridioides sp. ZZV15-6597]|uniref:hypothetical protein n=1 Tax=Clostridioides sp. ZZV15-6597 TaxID=2811500 RepID=UPI001D11E078|nr:hypothetical protein [Clostridioides sp. ZZV15-6597]HBF1820689.1 hypothetical protein [Clostridioides difficile]
MFDSGIPFKVGIINKNILTNNGFYTVKNRKDFNKNTIEIKVIKGYVGNEYLKITENVQATQIKIFYRSILDGEYFVKSKEITLYKDNFYKEDGKIRKRLSKEILNALEEFEAVNC